MTGIGEYKTINKALIQIKTIKNEIKKNFTSNSKLKIIKIFFSLVWELRCNLIKLSKDKLVSSYIQSQIRVTLTVGNRRRMADVWKLAVPMTG